ncbi:glycosyltransferase [Aeromonas jandaei]|uniref:glycosyltransferase n=1 Tax=Aeromonas jandaei TaxID=650 RepID=UPI001C5ACA55|nr:glycosyltransferase [Aeromonas jandaei]MBW3762552.1 glycosyltransferase [Aeromonas jandaei]
MEFVMGRVIVFGTGRLFQTFLPFIHSNYNIIALSDNDIKLHGSIQYGIKVIDPATIGVMDFDFIIVASMYFDEISSQLINLGVSCELIRSVYNDASISAAVARYLISHPEFESARAKISSISDSKNKLIVMNSLGRGGAERALLNLCRRIEFRIKVLVVVIEGGGDFFNDVNNLVSTVEIFTSLENRLLYRCLFIHYSAFDICNKLFGGCKYDTATAYIEGLSTYLVSGVNSHYRVACVHANLDTHHISKQYYVSLHEEYNAYAMMDRIIFVSESVKKGFMSKIGDFGHRMTIIGNIFDVHAVRNNAQKESGELLPFPYFVAVGRLVEVKGFDKLVRAYSKAICGIKNPLKLVIIGDGPLKENLQRLISSLGMEENIYLLGQKENPYSYIYHAQCLFSSSASEGHPLAIGEAIILGTPVIATNCEGNAGMLANGRYGYLCENDEDGLTSALYHLLTIPMYHPILKFKSISGQNSLSGKDESKQWNGMILRGE